MPDINVRLSDEERDLLLKMLSSFTIKHPDAPYAKTVESLLAKVSCFNPGDVVSMRKWDATEPPRKAIGDAKILRIYASTSQTGYVADVMSLKTGEEHLGLDIAWLTRK